MVKPLKVKTNSTLKGLYIKLKTLENNKLGFKNCFNCGSMTHYKEKRYFQIKGFFAGHILCANCWKGRNDKR